VYNINNITFICIYRIEYRYVRARTLRLLTTTTKNIGFYYYVYTVTTEQQAAAAKYVWCILRPYGTGRISYLGIARAHTYTRTHTHTYRHTHLYAHSHTHTLTLASNVYGFIVCVCVYDHYTCACVWVRRALCPARTAAPTTSHLSNSSRRRRRLLRPLSWTRPRWSYALACVCVRWPPLLRRTRYSRPSPSGDRRLTDATVSLARAHVQTLLRGRDAVAMDGRRSPSVVGCTGVRGVKTNRQRRRRRTHVIAPRANAVSARRSRCVGFLATAPVWGDHRHSHAL